MEWRVCERYGISQLFLQGPTDRYVQFVTKLDRKLQNVGRVPNRVYRSALYAAQDAESKDFLMQEMQYRKGNVSTRSI